MNGTNFQDTPLFPSFGQPTHESYGSPPMPFAPNYGSPGSQQNSYMPTEFDAEEPYGAGHKRQRVETVYYEDQPVEEKDAGPGKQDPASKRP